MPVSLCLQNIFYFIIGYWINMGSVAIFFSWKILDVELSLFAKDFGYLDHLTTRSFIDGSTIATQLWLY